MENDEVESESSRMTLTVELGGNLRFLRDLRMGRGGSWNPERCAYAPRLEWQMTRTLPETREYLLMIACSGARGAEPRTSVIVMPSLETCEARQGEPGGTGRESSVGFSTRSVGLGYGPMQTWPDSERYSESGAFPAAHAVLSGDHHTEPDADGSDAGSIGETEEMVF